MPKPLPKGHLSILDKAFKYVPASGTDIAKTFARLRRKHAEAERAEASTHQNVEVLPMRKRKEG